MRSRITSHRACNTIVSNTRARWRRIATLVSTPGSISGFSLSPSLSPLRATQATPLDARFALQHGHENANVHVCAANSREPIARRAHCESTLLVGGSNATAITGAAAEATARRRFRGFFVGV